MMNHENKLQEARWWFERVGFWSVMYPISPGYWIFRTFNNNGYEESVEETDIGENHGR